MKLFIFKSESRAELGAFAATPDLYQLPQQLGPWQTVGVVRPENEPPYNLNRDTIHKAIADQGFQLFRKKSPAKTA